jgi:hypothetical protein
MTAAGEWSLNFQVNSISKRTMKTFYVGARNVDIRPFPESAQWGLQCVCNMSGYKCVGSSSSPEL